MTKDGEQIHKKRSVQNARRPKRCDNKDHGHHHTQIHRRTQKRAGGAFTKLKSTHFAEGQRYDFLATVIPEEKYRVVGVSAAQREQLVAQHKEEQTAYADYLGLQEAGKELLL